MWSLFKKVYIPVNLQNKKLHCFKEYVFFCKQNPFAQEKIFRMVFMQLPFKGNKMLNWLGLLSFFAFSWRPTFC